MKITKELTPDSHIFIEKFTIKEGKRIIGKIYKRVNGKFAAEAKGLQSVSDTFEQAMKDICFLNDKIYFVCPIRYANTTNNL